MSKNRGSRVRELRMRWAVLLGTALLGTALLGGAPRPAEAQPKATQRAPTVTEAERLSKEAGTLAKEGKYDAALPLLERALALQEKALGKDHPDVATLLKSLATVFEEKGDYARAESLQQQALSIREKAFGPDHPDVARSITSLANVYQMRGDYVRAETLFLRALGILEKALGPNHLDVATLINNLAILYTRKGDFARAETLYQRSLAIREKALAKDDPRVGNVLNNLALVSELRGDYASAEALHQRSLAIWEKALGPDHPDVALSLNNLANVAEKKGDYKRAESFHKRALSIREKAFGKDHPDVASSLNDLANVYEQKGDYARAEAFHKRALSIREKALGPDHPNVGLSLNNLANVYQDKGDYVRAEPLYQRAATIFEKTFGEDHSFVATPLMNLGHMHYAKGDYAHAEQLQQRALALQEKALGKDHPLVASALGYLGSVYAGQGAYARAEPLYQRALTIREKALGEGHPDVAESQNHLAVVAAAKEDYPRAIALFERAAGTREKNLALYLAADAEVQKRSYVKKIARDLDNHFWLALRTGDRRATALALTTLLRRKGRVLDVTADSMRHIRGRLGAEEQKLFEDLLAIRSERSTLIMRGADWMPIEDYQKRLTKLEAEDQALESAISEKSAAFRTEAQPITMTSVKAALPAGAALVEWSVYQPFHPNAHSKQVDPPRFAACVLPHQGAPACVDLGEVKPIQAAITKLRAALGNADRTHDPKPAGRALDALVMQPVRALLGDTRWALLSPDGDLNLIPFEALVDEQGRYLIERFAFTYLTSGRDLLRFGTVAPPKHGGLVVAAPDFGVRPTLAGAKPEDATYRGLRSVDMTQAWFTPLPSTEKEGRAIESGLPGAHLLLGAQATESAVKAVKSPRILHLATHGFFLPNQPETEPTNDPSAALGLEPTSLALAASLLRETPLLRAGLALAGANPRMSGDKEDGILTALEVSSLDLSGTELVVLSACQTGLGDAVSGEGVYGLRRALVMAGAKTHVISLWEVDTGRTREMMIAYYDKLKAGGGRGEALRQVRLEMLGHESTSHPHLWASFIVSGDWRTLEGASGTPDLRVRPGSRGCACAQAGDGRAEGLPGVFLAGLTLLGTAMRRRRARQAVRFSSPVRSRA